MIIDKKTKNNNMIIFNIIKKGDAYRKRMKS